MSWYPLSITNITRQDHARRLLPSSSGWLRAIRRVNAQSERWRAHGSCWA